jgi:Arylsulfotransferase (ASST)
MKPSAQILLGVATSLVLVGADCGGESATRSPAPPAQHFRSRPDLKPPIVTMTRVTSEAAPGYVFLAPKKRVAQAGPMIIDNTGELVWFHPLDTRAVADFRVQTYDGRPVLTWWRGKAVKGVGDGYYVIMDSSYREIATVTAGNDLTGDIHEFLITPQKTALITIYERVEMDLTSVGGPKEGSIFDGVVQEIDIASGRVLVEWRSANHVTLAESYTKPPPARHGAKAAPYDYFHINSIDVEPNGDLLVSARNTHAVYAIRREDGRVLWRLGGKQSDFALGPGVRFQWQHDARRRRDGTITLFDNGADPKVKEYSRVLAIRADTTRWRASLVRSYAHPRRLLATSQGNAQFLPDGHVFVGWGARPSFTEFDRNGRVLLDGQFGSGADSYRAYRFDWTGNPSDTPVVAATRAKPGAITVYASWNGATLVDRWQILAGPDSEHLRVVASAKKAGFETAITLRTRQPYIRARALNLRGGILGTSRAIDLRTRKS